MSFYYSYCSKRQSQQRKYKRSCLHNQKSLESVVRFSSVFNSHHCEIVNFIENKQSTPFFLEKKQKSREKHAKIIQFFGIFIVF